MLKEIAKGTFNLTSGVAVSKDPLNTQSHIVTATQGQPKMKIKMAELSLPRGCCVLTSEIDSRNPGCPSATHHMFMTIGRDDAGILYGLEEVKARNHVVDICSRALSPAAMIREASSETTGTSKSYLLCALVRFRYGLNGDMIHTLVKPGRGKPK